MSCTLRQKKIVEGVDKTQRFVGPFVSSSKRPSLICSCVSSVVGVACCFVLCCLVLKATKDLASCHPNHLSIIALQFSFSSNYGFQDSILRVATKIPPLLNNQVHSNKLKKYTLLLDSLFGIIKKESNASILKII